MQREAAGPCVRDKDESWERRERERERRKEDKETNDYVKTPGSNDISIIVRIYQIPALKRKRKNSVPNYTIASIG